jgi:hypothetical protein
MPGLCRQHMMDEIAVNAAITVFKRVDKEKSESEHRSGDHGVDRGGLFAIEGDHPIDEGFEILWPCADVIWNWRAGVSVVFAHEATLGALCEADKPTIADDDLLQT